MDKKARESFEKSKIHAVALNHEGFYQGFAQCKHCELAAVQKNFCYFCKEAHKIDVVDLNQSSHATHAQPLKSSDRVIASSEPQFQDHAGSIQALRVGDAPSRRGGGSAHFVDGASDESHVGRVEDGGQDWAEGNHDQGRSSPCNEEGISEEVRPDSVPRGPSCGTSSKPDNSHVDGCGRKEHHLSLRAGRDGGGVIRQVWSPDLPTSAGGPSILLPMGAEHCDGVRQPGLATGEIQSMVGKPEKFQEGQGGDQVQGLCEANYPSEFFRRQFLCGDGRQIGRTIQRRPGACCPMGIAGKGEGEVGSPDGGSDSQRTDLGGGSAGGRSYPQESPGDVSPRDVEHDLSAEDALRLVKGWHAAQNPFSEEWKSLVQHKRPLLMELACFPDSKLGEEVESRFGKGSSIRCSLWNGGNLETPEGISHAKRMLDRFRPVHLWIACDCAPFCPLQRLNRKTPDQCRKLEEKQANAVKQYKGAMEVADFAASLNISVHWELSEKCEAWKLPEVCDFLERHQLEKVTCHGCTVGLRTRDGKLALCKGWTIATSNRDLLAHLNLRCQRNHPKGCCEAGQAQHTARYTVPFVRKVIDNLSKCEMWSNVLEELQKDLDERAFPAEVDEEEEEEEDEMEETELSEEEKKERADIRKKLNHIHQSTGHGSKEALLEALRRRGCHEKVMEEAQRWRCTMCEARKRMDPRRFATLESVAQKGERLQIDVATWVNEITKKKYYIMVMIDEGSYFRVARVIATGKGNTAKWEIMRKTLEENWVGVFGFPKVLRVDPAGPWTSKAAMKYADEKHIDLVAVPAEAHHQIGIVEGAIKNLKGMLDTLTASFPSAEVEELVARSVWVCNNMETERGFSPFQRMLGKAPDDAGRFFKDETQVPLSPALLSDGGFEEDEKMRTEAEKAFLDEQSKRRLDRALRMGRRGAEVYLPGDLVFYWRNQVPLSEKTTQKAGRFLGPARVLATETRREPNGELRPGHVVWVHRNNRLIKCVPEQLRKASPFERQIETLQGPVQIPWTITAIATSGGRQTYIDATQEIPTDEQWQEAETSNGGEPPEELRVSEVRMREKGKPRRRRDSLNPSDLDVEMETHRAKRAAEEAGVEGSHPEASSSRRVSRREDDEEILMAFYTKEEHRKVFEIEWELPQSRRGTKKFLANPEAYVVSQIKRRQVEIHEKHLSPEELKEFKVAKGTEVRNFLSSGCFERYKEESQMNPRFSA